MLNPYDVGYGWWVVFVIGLIICVAVGIAAALQAVWHSREKRDGKR